MKQAKFTQVLNWSHQSANEAMHWAKVQSHADIAKLEAFGTGYQAGYMQAIRDLKMHDMIDIDYDK